MALPPGAVVGGYRIVGTLGSGGMGAVYLGQHPSLPRRDAIKILNEQLSTDPEFRARFEREGDLAARLDHPNIVSVYNRGEEAGQLWIAMQYIPGTDASEEVAKGPSVMTPQRALRIAAEVGKGLDYAHRQRLLHRDIKPANFLLSHPDDEEEERVLLTDFGVAKSVEDGQDLTATGKFMATVAYASPEQLLGQQLDHRSDIYSLGCSLFRLLTGSNPFPSTVPAVVMMGHLNEPPPRITEVRRDLPPALDRVFEKVLAKRPEDRYSTCREFVDDAEAALYGQVRRHASGTGYRVAQTVTPTATYRPGSVAPHDITQRDDQQAIATWPGHRSAVDAAFDSRPTDNRRPKLVMSVVVAIVAILAIAGGVYVLGAKGEGTSGPDLARVRSDHPEFAGKTVAALHYGNTQFSAVLDGSPQADFLRDIGFRYSTEFQPVGKEDSPRPLALSGFGFSEPIDLIVLLRSDTQAGNGGLGGLPSNLMTSPAKIAVIDEVGTLQAFQVWTDQSPDKLVTEMVPVLSKALA